MSSDFYREKTFFPPFFLPSLFSLFPNLHEKFIRRFVCRPTLAKPSIHATLSTSRNILIAAKAAAFQFASPPPMSRARWMRNDRVTYQFLMDILVPLRARQPINNQLSSPHVPSFLSGTVHMKQVAEEVSQPYNTGPVR